MNTKMGLELTNFMNSDLTWNTVKKGHRSMTRRPRKPGASSFMLGIDLGNEMPDSSIFESEKSGVAVLGHHFAEKVVDVPIKKRRLLRAPLRTPLLNSEGAPQSQTPSPPLAGKRYASGQLYRPNSLSKDREKSKDGFTNSRPLKLSKEVVSDFSGIELLASAACTSCIIDSADHVEESSVVEELVPPGVDSCTVGLKETILAIESDGSSVLDSTVHVSQNLHDKGNDEGEEKPAPSREVRLHWDLNTVMDDWEEPCYNALPDSPSKKNCSEVVCTDTSQSGNLNLEGEKGMTVEIVSRNQLLLNSESTVLTQSRETESYHSGNLDAATWSTLLPDKYTCEIASFQGGKGVSFQKTNESTEEVTCSREVTGTVTWKTSDVESSLCKSDVIDSFIRPVKSEDFSISTTHNLQGQAIVKGEQDTIHKLPARCDPTNIMSKSNRLPVSKEEVEGDCQSPKLCVSDADNKLTSEDPLSDCCGSNVSHEEQGRIGEGNTINKVEAGYDSPFEDGELREPIGYAWDDGDADEKVDCVDYESDNLYEDEFDTVESEKTEVSRQHGQTMEDGSSLLEKDVEDKFGMVRTRGLSPLPDSAKADTFMRPNCLLGAKSSVYPLQEHSEHNDGTRKFLTERNIAHDESSTLRGNMWRDSSKSFDVCRNGQHIRRSRSGYIGESYSRAEGDFGPERFMGRDRAAYQGRCRNDVGGQWVDSSMGGAWDARRSHGYPRPRNVIGESASRSGGPSSHDNHSRNYNPRDVYRTFNRRLSPSDRKDSYGTHRLTAPVRGFRRDRGRGGSGFHQGLRRPHHEEYHDSDSCFLERKDRFPPNFNRGAHLSRPRRRSRSRSRSRSPIAWHFPKGQNVDTKRQSPEYKSEARFQGERFPFRKPTFEIEAGFVSPTRGRFSPERPPRCFDDRNFTNDQFRDRRLSPVGMFRRNQKFESVGYTGRLKSDDYFRPTQRPGRFSHMDGPGRERKYEDSISDNRKCDDKHEMMNRTRRYGDTGGVNRLRYAADDSFEDRNPRNEDNCFSDARNEDTCF